MGKVDVTELLVDPDFVDPITLVHRVPNVDQYGNNQLIENCEGTFGSVQPASGKTLQRLPDEFRVANVMSFFVKGIIVSDGRCLYPDLIVFRNQRYAVQVVFDWTNWAAGWCEGTCVREVPTA